MTGGSGRPSRRKSLALSLACVEETRDSGRFVSGLLAQLWDHASGAVSVAIRDALELRLMFLEPVALRFVRLDLGNVPIRTRNMSVRRVGSGRAGGEGERTWIQIDVDVDWRGNCDVMLQADLKKSAKFTFGVKYIQLSGRMHILLGPLTAELPVISAVQCGFANPPLIQMEFTGAVRSVANFSLVQPALVSAIQSALAGAAVLPQRRVLPVNLGGYDYLDAYRPPVGMVRVAATGGRGFKVSRAKRILKATPDVYCLISLGASGLTGPKFRTSTQYDNLNPSWKDESCDFILYDMEQKVYLQVLDKDRALMGKDDDLGKAEISVRDLFKSDRRGVAELELQLEGGEGTNHKVALSAELFHTTERLGSFFSPIYQGENHLCGLVTIIITRAFDIPIPRADTVICIKVIYGEGTKHEKIFYTPTVKDFPTIDARNPMFDCAFHVPVTSAMLLQDTLWQDIASCTKNGEKSSKISSALKKVKGNKNNKGGVNDIVFTLMDGEGANSTRGRGVLGKMTVRHEELVNAPDRTITETPLIGYGGARLKFRVTLSGMQSEEEKLQEISFSCPQSSNGGVNTVFHNKDGSNLSPNGQGDPSSFDPLRFFCGLWEPVSTFFDDDNSLVATDAGSDYDGKDAVVSPVPHSSAPSSPCPYHTSNLDTVLSCDGPISSSSSSSCCSNRMKAKTTVGFAPLSPESSLAASLAHVDGVEASGNFLSGILVQIWNHLNIAVSNAIKHELEPTLRDLKPVSLDFVRLDLGDVPIRVKNLFIHSVDSDHAGSEEKPARIQIDFDVDWDGSCDIMLQANLTKSAKVSFGVKSIKLSGRMHILLGPLTTVLPVISAVQYGFTNPPSICLEFTGAVKSVANFSVVQSALVSVIHSALVGALVLPQRRVVPINLRSYNYLDTYQPPVGMVRVTVVGGSGFKVLQKFISKDIPDIYCLVSLGASSASRPEFRTSTKYDDLNPLWKDESCDFILYDMDQMIYLKVMDEDMGPFDPDDELGKAKISIRNLFRIDRRGVADLELELEGGEKTSCHITLSAELFYISEHLGSFSSPNYQGHNQLCGLVTIIVTKALDISIPGEDAATCIKVVYAEGTKYEKIFYTRKVTDCRGTDDILNPTFDSVFQVPISASMLQQEKTTLSGSFAKGANDIVFTLTHGSGASTKGYGELGTMTVTHEELLNAYRHTITETRPIGDGGASLEFRVIMSGIQSSQEKLREISFLHSNDDSSFSSLGAPKLSCSEADMPLRIRTTVVHGRGFMIKQRPPGKKEGAPDVYCNIHLISRRKKRAAWKTRTIKDDTKPQWNESRDFDLIDPVRDSMLVEVYQENSKAKDEYFGAAEFSVEKLLRKQLLEVELRDGSILTKMYITLRCVQLDPTNNDDQEYDDMVAPLPSALAEAVLDTDGLDTISTNSTGSRSMRAKVKASKVLKKMGNTIYSKKAEGNDRIVSFVAMLIEKENGLEPFLLSRPHV